MKRLFLPVLVSLSLFSGIKADEPFYSNTWMGIDYEFFINDKEPLENGYLYKFRTRFESSLRITINDWRIADCLKSTVDGELVPAITRYGYERGMPELIREICGGWYKSFNLVDEEPFPTNIMLFQEISSPLFYLKNDPRSNKYSIIAIVLTNLLKHLLCFGSTKS